MYIYNGVVLPEIPPEVVSDYPYFTILDETYHHSWYALIAAKKQIYVSNNTDIGSSGGIRIYRVPEGGTEWNFIEEVGAYAVLETVDGVIKSPLWTNDNINSLTSPDVVVYPADDIPINVSDKFIISRETMKGIADAARLSSGKRWLLSTSDIESILANRLPANKLPEKIAYYNDFNGHKFSRISTYLYAKDADGAGTVGNIDVNRNVWCDKPAMYMKQGNGEGARGIVFHSKNESLNVNNGFDGTKSWSIGAWFKREKIVSDYGRLFNCYPVQVVLFPSSTTITTEINGDANSYLGANEVGVWIHLCVVCEVLGSNNVIRLYKNGSLCGEKYAPLLDCSQIMIGTVDPYLYYGWCTSVFFADGALTVNEIREMMFRD